MHKKSHQDHQIPTQNGCTQEANEERHVQPICLHRPARKIRENRTWITVGGDHINYPGEVANPTDSMMVA